ncbi:alpha/beta hydrolase [Streptomyces sp. CAS3]
MAIGEHAAAQPSRDRDPKYVHAFVSPPTQGCSQPAEAAVSLIALAALNDASGTTHDNTFSSSPAEMYEPSAPDPEEFEPAEELTLDANQPRDFAEMDRISRRQLAADLDRPAPAPTGPTEVTLGISGSDTEAAGTTLADLLQDGGPESFENKNMPRLVRTVRKPAPEDIRRTNAYHLTRALALGSGLPCRILCYEPEFEGVGRMAVAIGDIETATHVAVLVPGMGSSPANFVELVRRARDVHDECRRISPEVQVAVIAWQGYKAPRDFFQEGKGEVSDDKAAKDGSRLLNVDMAYWRALWKNSAARTSASLPPQPQITVNGHSYGTTVAGYALMRRTQPGGVFDAAKGALAGTTRELFRQALALFPATAVAKKRMQGESWTRALTEGGKKTLPIAEFAVDPSGLAAARYLYNPMKSTITRSVEQARTAYKSEPLGGGEADNLVLFGSPGTGRRAQHLNLPPSHIYAAAHKNDTISHLNFFSIDPTHIKYDPTDRVIRLRSEYSDDPALSWKKNRERAHTSYYDPATETQPAREALTNLARIITGKSHEVTTYKKRTGIVLEGHKNPLARLVTNPPTNTPQPNRKKTTEEKREQGITKTRTKRATGETKKEGSTSRVFDKGFPTLQLWKDWHSLTISDEEPGKLFSVYGTGIAASKFMNISTERGTIEVKFKKEAMPVGYRNGLYIVKLSGGETECYVHEFEAPDDVTIPLGFPEEGTVIVLALMKNEHPDIRREHIPEGKDKIKQERLKSLGLYPFPLSLTVSPPEDFSLLKAIIDRQPWALSTEHPAAAVKTVIDSVRRYFTEEEQEDLSPEQRHLTEIRKSYTFSAQNLNNRGRSLSPANRILLEKVLKDYTDEAYRAARFLGEDSQIFGSASSIAVASEQKWISSGEVYLADTSTYQNIKIEKRPGSGRAFALNNPPSSFVFLPPWCDFRATSTGGEVKCQPPISTRGDRLPVLLIFLDHKIIDIIPMDNEWHSITSFDKEKLIKDKESLFGAIVTSNAEKRALPSIAQKGRKLDPYPLSTPVTNDHEEGIEKTVRMWTEEIKLIEASSFSAGAIDWRGLARSLDPWLAFAKEIGIREEAEPVAKVLLKGVTEIPQSTPLARAAEKMLAASDSYHDSIKRIIPFHYFEYTEKYSKGRIPSAEEVVSDLEAREPNPLTVSHREEWRKAKKIWQKSKVEFDAEASAYSVELNKVQSSTASISRNSAATFKKNPLSASKSAFLALLAINFGASVVGGGLTEGDILDHAVAAGSSIAVAMPLLENSLTALGGSKAAGKIAGKATPFVSIAANVLSLSNNLRKEKVDEWAVTLDLLAIAADSVALLGLKFSILATIAGPLGTLAALPSIYYTLRNMGTEIPLPDDFVREFGESYFKEFTRSLDEHRADLHQNLESLGAKEEVIAGLWNETTQHKILDLMLEKVENQVASLPLFDAADRISMVNGEKIQEQVERILNPGNERFFVMRSPEVPDLYRQLAKYCIRRIRCAVLAGPGRPERLTPLLSTWLRSEDSQQWREMYMNLRKHEGRSRGMKL